MPWWLGSGVRAQDPAVPAPALGFIRLFDAVSAGSGALEVSIDGASVRPDGYRPGDVTGGIGLPPRIYQVMFRREGVKAGGLPVTVAANDTTTLVAFAEWMPVTVGAPDRWRIRILKLSPLDAGDKRTASFVSVSRHAEVTLEIRQGGKWQSLVVKRLATTRADIRQARGYVPLRCNGQTLPAISVSTAGHFVTVLYDDENGAIRARNFQDYHYAGPK